MISKEKKIIEVISLKLLAISLLFVVSLFAFALIANGVLLGKQRAIDNGIFSFFNSFSTPGLIQVMEVFSFFGSVEFLIPAYIVLIGYFFWRKKFRQGVDILIIGVSSTLMMFALKEIFHRQRPDLPIIKEIYTYSFPSGHALSSFIFCSILIFIIKNGDWKNVYKWAGSALLLFLSITIGISRIVLRAHYATDVIASFCLGIVWVIVSLWLLKKINRQYLVKNNLTSQQIKLM